MNLEKPIDNELESLKENYISKWKEASELLRTFSQESSQKPSAEDEKWYQTLKTETGDLGKKLLDIGVDVSELQNEAKLAA